MKGLLVKLIRAYQKTISLDHGPLTGAFIGCRYYPSCSEYTRRCLEKYGILKGLYLGLKRVSRCHPLAKGGVDYP